MTMKITTEQLKELNKLHSKKNALTETISNAKKTYMERNGANLVKLERAGKEIEVDEKTLWLEIFHGGTETQAGEIMKAKYPEFFVMVKEQEALVMELNIFTAKNWGFFYNEMNLSTLIDIIKALVRYQFMRFLFLDRIILIIKKIVKIN